MLFGFSLFVLIRRIQCKLLQGLPLGWTDPKTGRVSPAKLDEMLPQTQAWSNAASNRLKGMSGLKLVFAKHQATKKVGCVSLSLAWPDLNWASAGIPDLFLSHEDQLLSRGLNLEILKSAAVMSAS